MTTRPSKQTTGAEGESLVAELLESRGYRIVGRNVRVGRLELDIVAERDGLFVVCEVRTRRAKQDGLRVPPVASVNYAKLTRVRQGAARWLRETQLGHAPVRIDVAAVVLDAHGSNTVDYYENASMPARWEH